MSENYAFLGYGIRGYRSFTQDSAYVGPFGKMHAITGQNNSGKSALADIAWRVLPSFAAGTGFPGSSYPFTNDDLPMRQAATPDKPFVLSLCFSRSALMSNATLDKQRYPREAKVLERLLSLPCVTHGDEGICWIDFDIPNRSWGNAGIQRLLISKAQIAEEDVGDGLQDLSLRMANVSSDFYSNLGNIFSKLIPWQTIPQAIKIRAIREATSNAGKPNQEITGGDGLINELLRLSNPKPNEQYVNGEKWARFVSFVRDILDDENADVRIDAEATMIQVKTGGTDYLALSELGTGIEELVIMAAVVACNERKLIIIEEPEIHLHPTMQSKIVRNLQRDGNGNRFLITTHSPSILNSGNITVTQVSKHDGVSIARNIYGIVDAREALDDLGAHAADLLQSNYVVWVEGPSDRIYINYWLSQLAPELREGTHYSVMIYGGKLLNACRASEDSETEELISLFRINSHFCVLMDSDRDKPGARISKTKVRIRKECEQSKCLAWVTDGRTIENYVPADILREAINALYPGKKYSGKLDDPYTCPLGEKLSNVSYKPDKIRVARYVTQRGYDLPGNLVKMAGRLADDIRIANSMGMNRQS